MRKTVAQLMSVDFVTVTARMSLEDALILLLEADATELCVVDPHDHFEGIVTDFELLKSHVHGQLTGQCVRSLISRAVTVLAADMLIDFAVPMFRDGSCSRAYVCRDGRLLGRLSRTNVLRHLAQRELNVSSNESRPVRVATSAGLLSTIDTHETTPRAPQFMTPLPTSVLGGICVATPRLSSR
jgi:CBS-domain-containing membrane protein